MVTLRGLAVVAVLLGSTPLVAQPTQSGATGAAPSQPGGPQGGAMSGGMMRQGQAGPRGQMGPGMMEQGQAGPNAMMPMMRMMMRSRSDIDYMEGRLAFIQAELKITQAQTPTWNLFVDAVRGNAAAMTEMRTAIASRQGTPSSLPDRLALEEKAVSAHLTAIKQIEQAVAKLYEALSEDQKKIADTILLGPMGMPMGML